MLQNHSIVLNSENRDHGSVEKKQRSLTASTYPCF